MAARNYSAKEGKNTKDELCCNDGDDDEMEVDELEGEF
jgi:hypothetical protein